jgi:hypothetical protein
MSRDSSVLCGRIAFRNRTHTLLLKRNRYGFSYCEYCCFRTTTSNHCACARILSGHEAVRTLCCGKDASRRIDGERRYQPPDRLTQNRLAFGSGRLGNSNIDAGPNPLHESTYSSQVGILKPVEELLHLRTQPPCRPALTRSCSICY